MEKKRRKQPSARKWSYVSLVDLLGIAFMFRLKKVYTCNIWPAYMYIHSPRKVNSFKWIFRQVHFSTVLSIKIAFVCVDIYTRIFDFAELHRLRATAPLRRYCGRIILALAPRSPVCAFFPQAFTSGMVVGDERGKYLAENFSPTLNLILGA